MKDNNNINDFDMEKLSSHYLSTNQSIHQTKSRISKELVEIRKVARITESEIALRSNLSRTTVSKIEKHDSDYSLESALRYARALKKSFDDYYYYPLAAMMIELWSKCTNSDKSFLLSYFEKNIDS